MLKSIQLIRACRENNLSLVKKLLQCDLNVNAKDNLGMTALQHAAGRRFFKITQILLNNGANPDIKTHWGQTALDRVFDHYELVEALNELKIASRALLIQSGSKVNKPEPKEPSCQFTQRTHEETLRFFKLFHKHHARAFDAEKVFSTCKKYGIPEVMDILIKDGYDINKIRKQRELNERVEGKNTRLKDKKAVNRFEADSWMQD